MSTLVSIIVFTALASFIAIAGASILLAKKKLSHTVTHALSAFAAGVLLGAVLLDLLPEAFQAFAEAGVREAEGQVFLYALFGILLFFFLERFIHWFHHHHHQHKDKPTKAVVPLIVFGDGVHNAIDGVLIAATFMADTNLGIITTLAVAAHEVPQEIGDFGILLHGGLSRMRAFVYNLISQLTAVMSAVITYVIGSSVTGILPYVIAVTSGFFLYIALTDLIPDIHSENRKGFALLECMVLLVGILITWLLITFIEA